MNQFSRNDLKVVKKEVIWQGYFRMVKYYFTHALFNGGTSNVIERELFERDTAVAVIPYDPVTDEIVLVEQIRVGTFEHDVNPWMIELVAGMIEDGEQSADVAKRELFEETGLQCQRLDKVMSYLVSPGGTSEKIDLYIAQVDASTASEIAGLEEESEDIRTHRLSVADVIEQLSQSRFKNGVTLVGLQWLALNHQRIKHQWPLANHQQIDE
jgi:ADP-ribose pyrophosphatase